MTRAASVPAETDLLCEGCGYVLTGLPQTADARCPECGKPVGESTPDLRHPPAWERSHRAIISSTRGAERSDAPDPLNVSQHAPAHSQLDAPPAGRLAAFLRTTADCIFRPRQFFRSLSVRDDAGRGLRFAQIHWAISAVLLGTAGAVHAGWYETIGVGTVVPTNVVTLVAMIPITFLLLAGVTRLAARLTTWEATYRGIRLPLPLVLRGLHYHAAHYLPVSLLAVATVLGYALLLRLAPDVAGLHGATYLFVLSVEVLLSALYLFKTYWTGMRNLMYANGGSRE